MKFNLFVFIAIFLTSCASESHLFDGPTFEKKPFTRFRAKGLRKTEKSKFRMQTRPHISYKGVNVPVPGKTDLSPQVSLPENQGNCGCCWDFSLTKALRSEYMLHGKDPGVLDFNYLLANCGPGPKMDGCDGGDFTAAESFESGAGPGLNKNDPFIGAVKNSCKKSSVSATAQTYTMLGQGTAGPTFQDIAFAVGVSKHVLSIDVAAGSGDWENYESGIYNQCVGGSEDVDHMINLVGYDCETSVNSEGHCVFDAEGKPAKGDGYLIVMNNWGEDWGTTAANGHRGYMKTRMYGVDGSKCNAIATDALFFQLPPRIKPVQSERCTGFLCEKDCNLPWCKK